MERELEKIQKNGAAVVAHASVPDEAKAEIDTSVKVRSWTGQSCHNVFDFLLDGSLFVVLLVAVITLSCCFCVCRHFWRSTEQS